MVMVCAPSTSLRERVIFRSPKETRWLSVAEACCGGGFAQ